MKTELQQAIQDLESQLAELKAKAEEIEQEEWWEAPDFFEGECVPVELNKYLEFQRNLWCLAKELNGDWVPDQSDDTFKYFVTYDHVGKIFSEDCWSPSQNAGAIFSPDAIEKALHIMNTQKWYERFLK